jgi:hypothetical protein
MQSVSDGNDFIDLENIASDLKMLWLHEQL